MKAATCVSTKDTRATLYLKLIAGESIQDRPIPIDPPKLYHIWQWRLVLPLINELLHHIPVFLISRGNFQDCWCSAERGRAAMFRTEFALLTTNLNRWQFLATKTGVRHATCNSLTSVAIGAKFRRLSVCVDECRLPASRNDAKIPAWWRARPRVTGTLPVVAERFCASSPTEVVCSPIFDIDGLHIAVLAQARS